jgi:hypothetical protein
VLVTRRRVAIAFVALAAATGLERSTSACRPAVDPARVARPSFDPADAVELRDHDWGVNCEDDQCAVVGFHVVQARQAVRLHIASDHLDELAVTIDGTAAPVSGAALATGVHRIEIFERVPRSTVSECFQPSVLARHPWLGGGRYGPIVHGGPLVMAGVSSGAGAALRLRGGWEVAGPASMMYSLAVDTDASSLLLVAAMADVTTRAGIIPVSFSIGAGGIAVLAPDGRLGGRAQVSGALGPGRLVLSVDAIWSGDAGDLDLAVAGLAGVSM